MSDIRQTSASRGRTINLSISERGKRALKIAGVDREVLRTALPLKGRMLHLSNGKINAIPYDPHQNQVKCLLIKVYSFGVINKSENFYNIPIKKQKILMNIIINFLFSVFIQWTESF